jgi:hypothetical protein
MQVGMIVVAAVDRRVVTPLNPIGISLKELK